EARFRQPGARIIIDTVDVHFHRLFAKARLSQKAEDFAQARATKKAELCAYKAADFVVAVTNQDQHILLQQDRHIRVEIIPNIHKVMALTDVHQKLPNSLVFVGGFSHEPNVDAMLFFCQEILPLIRLDIPDVRVLIIGGSPPQGVSDLAGGSVEVLGYVPDTAPFLERSAISIAPLRFGAGMKGKIGEAMSYGLPVVTTTVGIEGFGLSPEENVLVGDMPGEFAAHVVRLIRDKALYEKIRTNGWLFIKQNYSDEATVERVYSIFDRLDSYPIKKLSAVGLIKKSVMNTLEKHLLWRFRGA
ncbi:MAG: glycosyltransferase family 4 protein, partial [Sulfuriferula sp.]